MTYKLVLEIGGIGYESEGETMIEAIKALPKPKSIRLRGKVKVSKGDLKCERLLTIPQMRRLLSPKEFIQKFFAAQFEKFLK
jgi:hypothetical protein